MRSGDLCFLFNLKMSKRVRRNTSNFLLCKPAMDTPKKSRNDVKEGNDPCHLTSQLNLEYLFGTIQRFHSLYIVPFHNSRHKVSFYIHLIKADTQEITLPKEFSFESQKLRDVLEKGSIVHHLDRRERRLWRNN